MIIYKPSKLVKLGQTDLAFNLLPAITSRSEHAGLQVSTYSYYDSCLRCLPGGNPPLLTHRQTASTGYIISSAGWKKMTITNKCLNNYPNFALEHSPS